MLRRPLGFRNEGPVCCGGANSKEPGHSFSRTQSQAHGQAHDNLGQAIHNLKYEVDGSAAEKR